MKWFKHLTELVITSAVGLYLTTIVPVRTLITVEAVTLFVVLICLVLLVSRLRIPGGWRGVLTRDGRHRIRLWAVMARDRADMTPQLVTGYFLERHRGRTGCSGETCSPHWRVPLPCRWVIIRLVLGGDFYCDTCRERISGNPVRPPSD